MRIVHVEDLFLLGDKRLGLQPIGGLGGGGRVVLSARVQRPKGPFDQDASCVGVNRIMVLGPKEIEALQSLSSTRKSAFYQSLAQLEIPCIILEGSTPVLDDLRHFAQEQMIPLLATHWRGPTLSRVLHRILEDLLEGGVHLQGVLVLIFGVGLLILGRSGIGKSECALDLVTRGHALVADDLVEIRRAGPQKITGASPELIRHHMEVRGLGIINIFELFGSTAVVDDGPIDLVVELIEWEKIKDMDRTGLPQRYFTILEKDLPFLRIPVSFNRNLATIMEVAVKNHLLQQQGVRPLKRLARKIESQLRIKASQ
jgi:HPr kinase/phosphorylase